MRPARFEELRDELRTAGSDVGKDLIYYRNVALELSWHVEVLNVEMNLLRKTLEEIKATCGKADDSDALLYIEKVAREALRG